MFEENRCENPTRLSCSPVPRVPEGRGNQHSDSAPATHFDPETGTEHEYESLPQHELFCTMLKDNRKLGNVDTIVAYNGKFRFQDVWTTSDDEKHHCGVFAIDLYEWHNLASQVLGRPQGCCGMYRLSKSPAPANASVATTLELPYSYSQPLNPFEGT